MNYDKFNSVFELIADIHGEARSLFSYNSKETYGKLIAKLNELTTEVARIEAQPSRSCVCNCIEEGDNGIV